MVPWSGDGTPGRTAEQSAVWSAVWTGFGSRITAGEDLLLVLATEQLRPEYRLLEFNSEIYKCMLHMLCIQVKVWYSYPHSYIYIYIHI